MSDGQYGRDDNDIQREGARGADPTMLDLVWEVCCTFEPLVCPSCTGISFKYLWGEHRVRCRDCGLEGSRPKEIPRRDFIEAKGGFTHYELERKSGLEYGVSLGARRRDLADKPVKRHGSGRSPRAGNRYVVETGFVRKIPSRNSHQTVYIAFIRRPLVRVGKAPKRRLVRVGGSHE